MAVPAALAESRTTPRPAVEYTELHSACRWYNAGVEAGLIRPAPVRPGATVAVVSPCSPVVCWWEHRAAQAGAYLESLGLRVRVMPHSGRAMAGRQVSPQARAEDLHAAFADPDVAVVLAAIGGDHAAELLPHLDYQLIRANPKLFQGYSDLTVLHWALLERAGLITFYGPALLPELGEHPTVLPYTDTWLRGAWFGTTPLRFAPATTWTDEFLDWDRRQDRTRPRDLRPSGGWVTIREGRAEGQLVAGCLETICRHLKGSPAWLDLRGALLVLETSEEVPPPHRVDAYLAELADAAVFDQSPGWWWLVPTATTRPRRCGCGLSWPVERRLQACRHSATWNVATPTRCSPFRLASVRGLTRPPSTSRRWSRLCSHRTGCADRAVEAQPVSAFPVSTVGGSCGPDTKWEAGQHRSAAGRVSGSAAGRPAWCQRCDVPRG
jgi:muramoyltetrapeptide carboxypeptidase